MNILIINTLYNPYISGGAEIICQELAEGLKSLGHNIVVLSTSNKKGVIKDFVNGIKVYRIGICNLYWHYSPGKINNVRKIIWHIKDVYNVKMSSYIGDILNSEQIDIALCHNLTGFSISIWDMLKKHRIPILQILHDQYLICPNSNAFKKGRACKEQCLICKIFRIIHSIKSNKVDVVIGVSNYILNRICKKGFFKQSFKYVIHNARNIPMVYKPKEWDGISTLKIGYIGTLSKVKGLEWLISSFMDLNINATLTIAGKGESKEYEDYLKKMSSKDDRIKFIGYATPLFHYNNIHLSIIPSLWPDTFPGVAYESCAFNIPVICTNIGGLPEIIKNEVNGLICSINNPDSLKNAILDCYNNPYLLNKLSVQARSSVESMLDTKSYLSKYNEIIISTLKR